MTKRQPTRQERRSDLDIPANPDDAHMDAWEEWDEREHYFDEWWYMSPWADSDPPEWACRARLDPFTYWHPWAECGGA